MNYPISINVSVSKTYTILIDAEDNTKCFHCCRHLKYSDFSSTIENVYCSLFEQPIKHIFNEEYKFIRCVNCVNSTKENLNKEKDNGII